MSIGSMLFTNINTDAFSRLDDRISDFQSQIASGKNDPLSSSDPVRASRLSAAKEQLQIIQRYENNIAHASNRLDQTDAVLSEVSNIMQRINEIPIRAASSSAGESERTTLRVELEQLKKNLIDLANSQDDTGGSLFGGYRKARSPFYSEDGQVKYRGDSGRHTLRASESADIATGLDGASTFMSIQTDFGAKDMFEIIDDLDFALISQANVRKTTLHSETDVKLEFHLRSEPDDWSFQLAGPGGVADISASVSRAAPSVMVDAINAASGETGITATLDADERKIILSSDGDITISQIDTESDRREVLLNVYSIDPDTGVTDKNFREMVPPHLHSDSVVATVASSLEHIADQRAQVGALGMVAKRHANMIQDRKLIMEQSRAGLEDLDVAKAVTELQTLLLNRDVSQQTFVKISQNSLFDYIR